MENIKLQTISDTAVLTNIEEVQPTIKPIRESSVLVSVFRVFIEGPKNFLHTTSKFFQRYYVHYAMAFRFFHTPTLNKGAFQHLDYKKNAQYSFEALLLMVAALIFMIKQNWVVANTTIQAAYDNDIAEIIMEVAIVSLLALAFFLQLTASIVVGRLIRFVLAVPVSKKESDILFCFLHTSFFSIAALMAYIFRCGIQYDQIEGTPGETGVYVLCFLLTFSFISWWAFKFARFHPMILWRKILFYPFSILLLTILFGMGMSSICMLILGM